MGDHYRIGQSSMSHSFQKNVRILTKFSGFMPSTNELVYTKNMLLDQANLFKYLKMSDPSFPDIRRSIKNWVEKNP